jgi:hypothetical protein
MKMTRIIALGVVTIQLVATSGCVNPDGTVNNTGTGALIGGTMGALIGAAAGGRHAGEAALIGGAAGLFAGALVGSAIDQRQREYLRAYYPQTYQTIQYNDAVARQQQYAAPQAPQPVPSASPSSPSTEQSGMVPLTLNDIKALTAAGVKPDVIKKEIDISQSKFTSQDIATAQQANPPIDALVIEDMKSHSG